MNRITGIFIALFLCCVLSAAAQAAPTMAFGYLANKSDELNFEYLETIFPNSFANSIKNLFNIKVIKPLSVNERLKKKGLSLQKDYRPHELPELTENIGSDFFIFGNFTPYPDNRIKIVLNLYQRSSGRVFTFTNLGRMETEIFKLVDRITMIIINFMGEEQYYRTGIIRPGSRLAILTNLDGDELNALYAPFMKKGYRIAAFQGNSLYNIVSGDMINRFEYISTRENSFAMITDLNKVRFLHGTWAGRRYEGKVEGIKRIFTRYDTAFIDTKNDMLNRLYSTYNRDIDYLIIIGFNKKHKRAWMRSIDVKNRDLMWMQSDIRGSGPGEIGKKMVERMSMKIEAPLKVK